MGIARLSLDLFSINSQQIPPFIMDYLYPEKSIAGVTVGLFSVLIAYLVGIAIHRLYFSPIAKFPGPKLAALTKWYEFYYGVMLQGQFTFQIQALHKIYGLASNPV